MAVTHGGAGKACTARRRCQAAPRVAERYVTGYIDLRRVIKSFKHKGLRRFFETGTKRSIQPNHESQLRDILAALDAAKSPRDMGAPGFRLHLLEPRDAGVWSVYVAKNWSVDFRFTGEHVESVDYVDHH